MRGIAIRSVRDPGDGVDHLGHLMEIFAQRPGGKVRIESRVGVGLTDQDERKALLDQHLTDRLSGIEIIAKDRNLVGPRGGLMLLQPPLSRRILTVLFRMAILWHDKLGWE